MSFCKNSLQQQNLKRLGQVQSYKRSEKPFKSDSEFGLSRNGYYFVLKLEHARRIINLTGL